jgi:pectinesterase
MNRIFTVQECPAISRIFNYATTVEQRTSVCPIIFIFIVCLQTITANLFAQSAATYPVTITVAKDGTGNYQNIQDAINALRAYSPTHNTIYIKNGLYKEKVTIPAWVTNLSIKGESKDSTILTNSDYSGKFLFADTINNKQKHSTFTSYTLYVQGNDIDIENMTIQNEAGKVGQAVALHVDGDRFILRNCNLLGNQDTLLTANDSARQYFENCFIEGTTDFIFGNATAVFNQCIIHSLSNSYITAASTMPHQKFGYVFMNCQLTANEKTDKVYLGRPWRAFAKTVFLNCNLGKHIRVEGWHNWGNKDNEATAFYAEYNNVGEGATTENRVAWSKQLSNKQSKKYTLKNIFSGWQPR